MGTERAGDQPGEVPEHLPPTTDQRTQHVGWSFRGRARFEAAATTFVAQAAGRGDRVLLVMEDPSPRQWPRRLLEEGVLQLASTAEVYGTRNVVESPAVWDAFADSLVQARQRGFSGMTIVADNTAQLIGPDQVPDPVAAWITWESAAERFIAEHPVTAVCGFDRERLPPDVVDRLMSLHYVTVVGR